MLSAVSGLAGFKPTPSQRLFLWDFSLLNVSKALKFLSKQRALKAIRLAASASKSNNEIAAGFRSGRDPFLNSAEWKAMRRKVIETYGARCMKCSYVPKDLRQINVDHIKPRKYYPHLALVFGNLQVLCCACNKAKGNKDETDYRPK